MGKRILVADDEAAVRQMLKTCLEASGYEVIEAVNGLQALEKILTSPPDLVILDELMPDIPGYQVATKLKQAGKPFSSLPIVVISTRDSMKYLFEELGVKAFLAKPFDPERLLSVIEKAIGQPPKPGPVPGIPKAPEGEKKRTVPAKDAARQAKDPQVPAAPPRLPTPEEPKKSITMTGGHGFYTADSFKEREKPNTKQTIEEKKGPSNIIILAGYQKTIHEHIMPLLQTMGYKVTVCSETKEAIKKSAAILPAFILSELSDMPSRFDTNRFYAEAKKNEKTRSIPFIAFCYEGVGFEDFTKIPMDRILFYSEFDLSDLKDKIKEWLTKFDEKEKI